MKTKKKEQVELGVVEPPTFNTSHRFPVTGK